LKVFKKYIKNDLIEEIIPVRIVILMVNVMYQMV